MKVITKHSGKRSIGLPGIIFFFHDGKCVCVETFITGLGGADMEI